jgi:hypothetical protein
MCIRSVDRKYAVLIAIALAVCALPDRARAQGYPSKFDFGAPASPQEVAAVAIAIGPDGKGLPAGTAQGRTDFGAPGFGGACPPPGDKPHRYIFTVYALKTDKIDVPADATAALVGFMINANKLGKASFEAKYGRSK